MSRSHASQPMAAADVAGAAAASAGAAECRGGAAASGATVSKAARRPGFCRQIGDQIQDAAKVWLCGVRDAVTLSHFPRFFISSRVIRMRTLHCFMLNGVIFLGSIYLFNCAIGPALGVLRRLVQDEAAWATDFIGSSFSILYKVLWIYPIYCISFVLNTVMYQEVADEALSFNIGQRRSEAAPVLARVIDETFRVLLNLVYIVEINLLYYIPIVGPPLYFLHSCWLASIYCFEYRWVHLRWGSNARLDYFERHWLYFAGFGFPVSVVSFVSPRFVDTGVFALLFPLCILTATTAEPRALKVAPACLRRLPIFLAVQCVSCLVLRHFEGRLASQGSPPPNSKGGKAHVR